MAALKNGRDDARRQKRQWQMSAHKTRAIRADERPRSSRGRGPLSGLRPTHALAQSLSKEFRRGVRRGEIRANNELLLDAAFRNPNRNHDLVVCQLIFGRFFKTEDSGE